MSPLLLLSWPGQAGGRKLHTLGELPDLLKAHPEGLCRSPYFFPDDAEETTALAAAESGAIGLGGPFLISHSIRRAADLLLEGCGYEGLAIGLEVDGKRLPEMPASSELPGLLARPATLVTVDQRSFRPTSEVFAFDQVYDDTVKFIDALKGLGVSPDAMAIFATPEEISIEVHPGVFGAAEDPRLVSRYRAILLHLAGVRTGGSRLLKTADRTIRLDTISPQGQVLLPGTNHPTLHRPKVGVGPSHFAYGPAAFSDFCGKKRTIDECLKELRTWLKFLETPRPALPAIATLLERLEREKASASGSQPVAPAAGTGSDRAVTGFQPLSQELRRPENPLLVPGPLATPWVELNKALAGGFAPRGVHLVAGGREEGKASLLLNLALAAAARRTVLFLSREQTQPEFTGRLLARLKKSPAGDWAPRTMLPGVEGESSRKKVQDAIVEMAGTLPPNLFFRGADSPLQLLDLEELEQLVKMPPGSQENAPVVVVLEGLGTSEATPEFFRRLRTLAASRGWIVLAGLHTSPAPITRPQFIEGADLELLAQYQGTVETVLHLQSERVNLKKFLAMAQGKVEQAVADKLEAKFTAMAGGERRRHDTFTLARILHSRWGSRSAVLFLYQREFGAFWEGPAILLGRP